MNLYLKITRFSAIDSKEEKVCNAMMSARGSPVYLPSAEVLLHIMYRRRINNDVNCCLYGV